jgi:hypothetical protein
MAPHRGHFYFGFRNATLIEILARLCLGHAVEIDKAAFKVTLAKNPKLRGMTIVVTDEHDNTICKVTVPSQH